MNKQNKPSKPETRKAVALHRLVGRCATLTFLGNAPIKVVKNDGLWLKLRITDVDSVVEMLTAGNPRRAKSCRTDAKSQTLLSYRMIGSPARNKFRGTIGVAPFRNRSTQAGKKVSVAGRLRKQRARPKSIQRLQLLEDQISNHVMHTLETVSSPNEKVQR